MKERPLKEVDTFSYLGSAVTRNGKIQNKMNKRIKKASVLSCKWIFKNKDINDKCKQNIFLKLL